MTGRWRFWALALLWLPAGVAATSLLRPFGGGGGPPGDAAMALAAIPAMATSLVPVAPCGLPLALACRGLWRLGHRRAAWWAGIGARHRPRLAASLVAGLLGPVAIAVCAVVLSLPAWIARYWLGRRG